MILKNRKLGFRFAVVFAILIFINTAGLFYTYISLQIISEDITSIYNIRLKGIDFLIESDRDAYQSSIAISKSFSKSVYEDRDRLLANMKSMRENLEQVQQRFQKFETIQQAAEKELMAGDFRLFHTEYDSFKKNSLRIEKMLKSGDINTAENLYYGQYNTNFEQFRGAIDRLTDMSLKNAETDYSHSMTQSQRIKITSISIIAVIIFISLLGGFLLTTNILGAVKRVLHAMENIARGEGDLTQRISVLSRDELGDLSSSFNTFIGSTQTLIAGIKQSSQLLVEAVNEISEGNQNLSQRTSEQASSLEEIAATIEETTATLKQNAENTAEAKNNSINTLEIVNRAKELSEEAIEIAKEGNAIVNNAVHSINEVSESSMKIGEIIDVINEISFQTNLLALNAAVEAARAGDQGKGFAVVAGEVRNLAQRSATSAKQIGDMIKDSIKKIEAGTVLVNKSGESLNKIFSSVNSSAKAMSEVTSAVKTIHSLITEIAASGEEQFKGIEQINVAINELDLATQQNASLVEETAAASEELTNQGHELMIKVAGFKTDGTEPFYNSGFKNQKAMGMYRARSKGTTSPGNTLSQELPDDDFVNENESIKFPDKRGFTEF